jgi:DNA (cytosine-5)-methyltransferase 1
VKDSYKFIDLFCGIGGFRLGFEKNNFKCVLSSDNNKNCQKDYNNNFKEDVIGDIKKIDISKIPQFDVLTAGFPCQPFSISGHKRGFEDTRGTLFFDICKIIEKKKPKVVVLENVKHFINHDKKRTLKKVIQSLEHLGYNVVFKLLNAIDFGLPQNRERIFIIGSKKGVFDFNLLKKNKSRKLEYFLENKDNYEYLKKSEYTMIDKKFVKEQDSGLIFVGYRNKNGFSKGIREGTKHLNRVHRQPNRIYSTKGYHPTIPSQESAGRFFIYEEGIKKVRKLSIEECYKIMGFPKNFKKSEKPGERYKQIGNSVAVNVVDQIAKQIIEQKLLDENYVHKYDVLDKMIFQDHVA